jgi:polyphosphate kinase
MTNMTNQTINLKNPDYYLNREISHLKFNLRVLEQATDERHPLLERLRFLLIFSNNLDEFFEIRVAGLKQQLAYERASVGPDGLAPQEVLEQISQICHDAVTKQYDILNNILFPQLKKENIRFIRRSEWTEKQAAWVKRFFRTQVLPAITPIGLDPSHPFPRLANKSLNFIVSLEGKDAFGRQSGLAIVPAPKSLPRLIRLPDDISEDGNNFAFLSATIHAHCEDLFPGMAVKGCYQFRVTRNADLNVDEDVIDDLAIALKGELFSRRYGNEVRLEVADNTPPELSSFLLKQFNLEERELYQVNGMVNLSRLMSVTDIDIPRLKYPAFNPGIPNALKSSESIFDTITKNDVLLNHPYESFVPVIDFIRQAAKDPNVLAIKQTLYRTGSNSEIMDVLVEAARSGKEVTAVIELRARFDEASNIEGATRLQNAGAVVCYGIVGYKTHAKMTLVVRKEGRKLKRYIHLGTGNYHAGNARIYTDYSLLTADDNMGADVHQIFQQLTGMGRAAKLKNLLHAPFTLHSKLLSMIEQERKNALDGKPAKIMIKCNALTERQITEALYKASQAGVKIDLIIRGICCLRPGIEGISDHIRVRSIIGRFLEHTRVYYFHNEGEPKLFCSSADLMERNLFRRVEACFPILDPMLIKRVQQEGLSVFISDNEQSWSLNKDGEYIFNTPGSATPKMVQHILLDKLAVQP